MSLLFLHYPRCGTCRKARAFLEQQGADFSERDIVADNPTREELQQWQQAAGLPLRKFFNTSGKRYRELALSEKLPAMTEEEQLDLLASDGMLVKRPILVADDTVLTGFRQAEWEALLLSRSAGGTV